MSSEETPEEYIKRHMQAAQDAMAQLFTPENMHHLRTMHEEEAIRAEEALSQTEVIVFQAIRASGRKIDIVAHQTFETEDDKDCKDYMVQFIVNDDMDDWYHYVWYDKAREYVLFKNAIDWQQVADGKNLMLLLLGNLP